VVRAASICWSSGQSCPEFFIEAESEEVIFEGTRAVETPTVGGDALGDLEFHFSFGREAPDEGLGEFVVSDAVLIGHGGDLAGEAVTERVHTGPPSSFFRFVSGRPKGVVSIGFEFFVGNHFTYLMAVAD
jgi:hypothetical protein